MITNEQRNNIHKLSTEDLIEILHECAEALGVVSVEDYMNINCRKRRTVFQNIKDNKIKVVNIAGRKFPVVNDHL